MEKPKRETKKIMLNGEKVTAYKYEGDDNWVVDLEKK